MPELQTVFSGERKAIARATGCGSRPDRSIADLPRENLNALGEAGVLGLVIPAQFGGAGGTLADMSRALERQAQNCASTAMIVLMHFCAMGVIAAKGSQSQKEAVLRTAARGEHLGTLAFSEAGSGGHFYTPVSEVQSNGNGKRLTAGKI